MYLKLIKEKGKELLNYYNTPFYVYLSLSNLCNANCKFCDVHTNKLKKCNIDVKKTIDELSSLGTKYIHFTGGGEPFFNDEIFEYLEYCTKKHINIICISNGKNLNEEKIKKMSKYNIVAFFFSIDSHKASVHNAIRRVPGIFEKVTENINLMKKYMPNVKIVVNHVLNKTNIDDFDHFIEMKSTVNFDYINPIVIKDCPELFFTDKQIEKYNKNVMKFYKLAKKYSVEFLCNNIDFFKNYNVLNDGDRLNNDDMRCVYPSYCVFIDAPSTKAYPCDCSIHRDRSLYCIGELSNSSFTEIWNGSKRENLQKLLLASKLDCKKKCDECNCQFNKYYFELQGDF